MTTAATYKDTTDLFGIMAEFSNAHKLVEKTRQAYEAGYRKMDAYAPFPVHGLSEALGLKRSWVPYIVLLGAIAGGLGGFFLQYYSSVIDYPLNIGGRPYNSWPSFMVITFETTVLGAALAGVLGMLALNKLPMPYHPLFGVPRFELASRDRFFLCIMVTDPKFDPVQTREFLEGLEPEGVYEVEQGSIKIYE
jgi:hypothetical protein